MNPSAPAPARSAGGALRLATALGAMAVIWLGLLPRLAHWPPVADHVRRMEQGGVNPAAMFYTELERLPLRPDWVPSQIALWQWPAAPRERR